MKEIFIKAKAAEDIPANRLVVLGEPDSEGLPTVQLPVAGDEPDFVCTRPLKAGEIATAVLKPHDIWMVEAKIDLPVGISVATADGGLVSRATDVEVNSQSYIGFTLNAAKAGEPVKIYRNYKVRNAWLKQVDSFINPQ